MRIYFIISVLFIFFLGKLDVLSGRVHFCLFVTLMMNLLLCVFISMPVLGKVIIGKEFLGLGN